MHWCDLCRIAFWSIGCSVILHRAITLLFVCWWIGLGAWSSRLDREGLTVSLVHVLICAELLQVPFPPKAKLLSRARGACFYYAQLIDDTRWYKWNCATPGYRKWGHGCVSIQFVYCVLFTFERKTSGYHKWAEGLSQLHVCIVFYMHWSDIAAP